MIISPPTKSAAPAFTAAQIANALARDPKTVREHLAEVAPAGLRIVAGKEAATWTVEQLPETLRQRLAAEAQRQHFRTVQDLLIMPRRRWEPPLPMDEIADKDIEAAKKLRFALMPSLAVLHDLRLSSAERDAQGVEDYRRQFGNRITARYFRELFARTLCRDNGFEEWNRLELYLPERPALKAAPSAAVSRALADDFAAIEGYIMACRDPHAPNEMESAGIWRLAFEKVGELVNAGESEKCAARRVRQLLFARCPFLAASRDALLKAFNRKLAAWQAAKGNARALRDGRANNGPSFALSDADRDLLIHRSVFYYRGDIAPAWRELLRNGFSAAVVERYAGKAVNKSHVPASIRDSIAPEVEIMTVMHQGRRAFDSIKGHVTRSYEGIDSLQCISGDDFTLNTYFYIPDGNGWFQLTRGQVILFIDFRTLRILGWALEPRKSYSSLTIRSLCTHVFGEFGVPEILYFERGIWKNATLLKGKTEPFGFGEISQGLREFGIQFKHAIRPRTKAVERVGGMFQDIAEAEPGYCGRDERRDAPESLRKQMAEVEARKVHPSKYFYSFEQWNTRLDQLVRQYNAEPQQGHILAGMSPDAAFQAYMNPNDPPKQFGAHLRYLLAHDKRQVQVTLNGVTIQVGKQKFNYKGAEIAHLVGRDTLAWFDPENPETITITNLDRTNPICVSRSENPNALESLMRPQSGTLGRELSRIEGQASHLKTRYNVVKAGFPLPQRQLLVSAQTVELGRDISAGKTAKSEQAATQQRQRGQANRLTAQTGIVVPQAAQADLDAEKVRRIAEFMNQPDAPETPDAAPSLTKENGKIIYQLKPSGNAQRDYVNYLLNRLTEFRKAGASYGQSFTGPVTFGLTQKIARSQLGIDLYAPENFEVVCTYLKGKIDGTIQGKRNAAKGVPNYHELEAVK